MTARRPDNPPIPMNHKNLIPWLAALAAGLAPSAFAQVGELYSDPFDTDTSAQWTVLEGSENGVPDYTADFAFDYSTLGVPAAPHSSGNTTRGLKLTVNKDTLESSAGTSYAAGVSLYAKDRSFSGNHALRVDMWLGYNGTAFGGTGSTEFGTFGINHAGNKVAFPDASVTDSDGVWFAVTGEGGASRDYRAYEGLAGATPVELTGWDAGFLDRDGDLTTEFEVNPDQTNDFPLQAMFPSPPFETPGAPGKRWVQVEVRQQEGVVTWLLDGYVIASRPNLSGFAAGTVMLGNLDVFASIAIPREENFVLFDNVRVLDLEVAGTPPEVRLTATDPDAAEPGTDTGTFVVTRTGSTAEPLIVQLRASGSATPDKDYAPLPATVNPGRIGFDHCGRDPEGRFGGRDGRDGEPDAGGQPRCVRGRGGVPRHGHH